MWNLLFFEMQMFSEIFKLDKEFLSLGQQLAVWVLQKFLDLELFDYQRYKFQQFKSNPFKQKQEIV